MEQAAAVTAVLGFAVVAGYAVLAWFRRGRTPAYADDASILMPAPPPEMTAATATIVDGGSTGLAFMAALLDLASRDEIAFEEEGRDGGTARVGIAIHGGDTSDPRILLNRRKPSGEGETWLLTQLEATVLQASGELGRRAADGGLPSPEAMQVGEQMLAAMLRFGATGADDDDSPAAREAREHGLLSGGPVESDGLASAYEARTGKPMPEAMRQRLSVMTLAMSRLSNVASIAQDPDGFASQIEAATGRPITPEQRAEMTEWATQYAAAPAAPSVRCIPAAAARTLHAPLLFGTFVQSYATRHGWLAALPVFRRLRWRLTGVAEIAVALAALALGSALHADVLTGLAAGVAAGGVVTYLIAPAMTVETHEGAAMKAQLAAYRRTLQLTFSRARTMDEAVTAAGLTWLETPDQALVWGVALGLRQDIEALLARTATDLQEGRGPSGAYLPAWYGPAAATQPTAVAPSGSASAPVPAPELRAARPSPGDAAAMFAGIEAIGSLAVARR